MTVWLITGASRGFGLEIAREALSRGDNVVATARDPRTILDAIPDAGDRLLALQLDVAVPAQVTAAVDAAVARFGRIDALINNAGRGLVGAVEETTDGEARAVFDVNVFGLPAVTYARCSPGALGSHRQPVIGRRVRRVARLGRVRGEQVRGRGAVRGPDPRAGPTGNPERRDRAGAVPHELPRLERTARDLEVWRDISLSADYAES